MKAARKVQALGPKTLVIKRGEHGVLMTRPGGGFFLSTAVSGQEIDRTVELFGKALDDLV